MTRKEVAKKTGASIRTIDRWIAIGFLPAKKYRRKITIDPEAFRKFEEAAEARKQPRTSIGNTHSSI